MLFGMLLMLCIEVYKEKKSTELHNKLITKQRPFYKTKRKRKKTNLRIAKPSRDEKDKLAATLLS